MSTIHNKANRSLSDSDFKYIFDNSVIGKTIYGVDGVLTANYAFCKLLGYTKDEMEGVTWQELTHPDDLELCEDIIDDLIENRIELARFKKRYLKKDGSSIWTDVSTSLRRDVDGAPMYFMTSVIDITRVIEDKIALANSQHRLKLIFEDSPYGIFVADSNGVYLDVNEEACNMTGYSKDELVGMNLIDLILSEDKAKAAQGFKNVSIGKLHDVEKVQLRYKTKMGETEIWTVKAVKQSEDIYIGFTEKITKKIELEKKLENQRIEAKALFDNAGLGIGYYKTDGHVIWYNKVAAENMGGKPEDFEGKTFWELFPKEDADKYFGRLNACIKKNGSIEYEDEIDLPIGKVYFRSIFNCIYDLDNNIIGVQIISQDITDLRKSEKALAESKKIFELMFDDAPLPYQSLDENGNFIQINKAWTELLGYEKVDVLGTSFGEYILPEFQSHFVENFPKFKETGETCTGFDMPKKDGGVASIQFHGRIGYNEDGTFRQTHCILQDVTEQKRAERLELEKQKAEQATKLKSEFLAKMSHEIRTPINAIVGFTDIIKSTELTDKQDNCVRKISGSSKMLLNIINDILDYSKIEAGKLHLEETSFSIETVLSRVKDNMQLKAVEKRIDLIVETNNDVPEFVIGDPLRLEQVLLNLTSNALKFTNEGSVEIMVEVIENIGNLLTIKFKIKDTGIGIKDEHARRLFSPFSQADSSTTRKYGGTGLGLVISKNLVEMMGGEIGVISEYGKGSDFSFTIKVYKAETTDKSFENRFEAPECLTDAKILIVIENNYTRSVFYNYLTQIGVTPKLLSCGEEAIEDISSNDYDLVIMDCKMRGLSGVESWHIIRGLLTEDKIPKVIMVTAYGTSDVIKAAESEHIDEVLIKPITQSKLYDTLMTLCCDKINSEYLNGDNKKRVNILKTEGVKILLVEDNEINQEVARELLELEGYIVNIASNGREALEMLIAKQDYKIVLMDVQMPVMDGYEATKKIREGNVCNDIPIIALSADAMKEAKEEAINAGMDDYITKPIKINELYKKIGNFLRNKQSGQNISD